MDTGTILPTATDPVRQDGDVSDPAAVPPAPAVTPTEADEPDQDLLVDFRGVSLRRDGRTLVGPIDWRVELDERWVVIGPNGAGKTSLMRLASAQVFPTEGTAHILGEVLGKTVVQDLTARIGVSTAALAARVPDDELVTDVVVSAGYAVLGRWRERYDAVDISRAVDVLESMGAEHLANRRFGTLSEGERKRVLISRALMTDPELMLLDEPAAGLDLGGREELVARLDTLARDPDAPATVLVTHHVEEIPPGFTHALLLKEGGVVAQGLIGDVLTAEVLSETFSQRILLDEVDGRYFARRASRPGRRRLQA
ncbi:ABC transporter ATP-binding protein [Tsukamurella spumae]